MCPYYLDGDLINNLIGDTRFIGYCAVFKVRGEAVRPPTTRGKAKRAAGRRRSLKTQQHVGSSARARGPWRAACQFRSTFLDPIGQADRDRILSDAP